MQTLEQAETVTNSPQDYFTFEVQTTTEGSFGMLTEYPHQEFVPLEGASADFYQMSETANFLENKPKLAAVLKNEGYGAVKEKLETGTTIRFAFPDVASQATSPETSTEADHIELAEYSNIFYNGLEFTKALSEGKLLIANLDMSRDQGKEGVPMHDALFHGVMYKALEQVPGFNASLRQKAASIVIADNKLPLRNNYEPEETDIAIERVRVRKDLGNFMEHLELDMSTAGSLAFAMNQIATTNERYTEDSSAAQQINLALRDIFSTVPNPLEAKGKVSIPDESVSDEQIATWTKVLFELAA